MHVEYLIVTPHNVLIPTHILVRAVYFDLVASNILLYLIIVLVNMLIFVNIIL